MKDKNALIAGLVLVVLILGYAVLTQRDNVLDCMERAAQAPSMEQSRLALTACNKKFPGELQDAMRGTR